MKVLLATFFAFSAFYVVQACVSCTPPACNTAPCNITIGCGCYRKSNTKFIFTIITEFSIEPLVSVNLFGVTVTKHVKCFFGREDDEIPDEVKNEELALEMLTMEAFELCKSGEDNCVTLNDIENCQVI